MAHEATGGVRSAESEDYRTERSEGGYAAGPERSAPEVATIGRQDGPASLPRQLSELLNQRTPVGERLSDQHADDSTEHLDIRCRQLSIKRRNAPRHVLFDVVPRLVVGLVGVVHERADGGAVEHLLGAASVDARRLSPVVLGRCSIGCGAAGSR